MIGDKKIEEAARLDDKEYYDRLSDNDRCFFEYGFRRGYNRALKGLFHPASEVPRNDNGNILALSNNSTKLYNMNELMDKTNCTTYKEMWEQEVKKYHLKCWLFAKDFIESVMKGGKQ